MDSTDPSTREAGQSAVDDHFDRASGFWDELYRGSDVYSAIHRLRQETALRWIGELGLAPGAEVLELGCGAGFTAVAPAQRGLRVRATDHVPAMLERARANAAAAGVADRITFAQADAQHLDVAPASIDLVVALGVIPWLPAPEEAIAEMARVTRPGGAVIANADNAARLHYALDPKLNPRLAAARAAFKRVVPQDEPGGAPARLHGVDEFEAMLDAAGLTKVRGQALGYGPFTLLGRQALPDRLGVRVHRSLQRRADSGSDRLAARGAQYLVLARRREEP